MPKLIQHRQEFRLGSFFKWLSTYGPFVDVTTDLGFFPDEASARQKAQSLMEADAGLAFRLQSDEGVRLDWIENAEKKSPLDRRHEFIGMLMHCIFLLLLSWLLIGWLNDGFFARGTLILTTIVGFFVLMGSVIQNRCENLIVWIIMLTLTGLAIPTFHQIQKVREKVERKRAAESSKAAASRPPIHSQ